MSTNVIEDSKRLMLAFQQWPVSTEARPAQAEMYGDLVEEEHAELLDALGIVETEGPTVSALAEVGDAIIDSIVVLLGLGHSLNLPLQEMWDEVLRSNMSKLHDGKLVRRDDGKVLKGPMYSPPDLQPLIVKQIMQHIFQ